MTQDYVLRMIQQIAAMVAAIVSKRRNGQGEEAQQEVEKVFEQHMSLPITVVRNLPPEALSAHLEMSDGNRSFRSLLLAELFLEDADLLEMNGSPEKAQASRTHAFFLLSGIFASLSREDQAGYRPRIEALAQMLVQGKESCSEQTMERVREWRDRPIDR